MTSPSKFLVSPSHNSHLISNKEFEITQVLRGVDHEHAYIVIASLEQHCIILRSSLAIAGELISPTITWE
jgi:hypothetical protein